MKKHIEGDLIIRTAADAKKYADLESVGGYLDISAEEERMVDALVAPGHPSTPGYTDPAYPLLPRR